MEHTRSDNGRHPRPGSHGHDRLATTVALASACLLLLAIPAFWPDYLGKFGDAHGHTHAHALLGTAWLALLVVQPLLIRARRRSAHRLLGGIGLVVGLAFIVSGVLLTHHNLGRMSDEAFARFGHFAWLPLSMTAIFAAALALAIAWRRVPGAHGRFMAVTALPLLDPLFARLLHHYAPPLPAWYLYQAPAFALATAVLFVLWARWPGRLPGRRIFAVFAVLAVLVLLGYFATPGCAAWLDLVDAFRALPLT